MAALFKWCEMAAYLDIYIYKSILAYITCIIYTFLWTQFEPFKTRLSTAAPPQCAASILDVYSVQTTKRELLLMAELKYSFLYTFFVFSFCLHLAREPDGVNSSRIRAKLRCRHVDLIQLAFPSSCSSDWWAFSYFLRRSPLILTRFLFWLNGRPFSFTVQQCTGFHK